MIRAVFRSRKRTPGRWFVLLLGAPLSAHAVDGARLYRVTVETVIPHVAENLHHPQPSERCLEVADLAMLFPILAHGSLAACGLVEVRRTDANMSFVLRCPGTSETTGTAHWRLLDTGWRGHLNVKLGGKNMTFSQRIHATPLGDCPS